MAPWRSIFACTKPLWAHSTTSFLSAFWETGRSKNARTTRRGKKYTAEYFCEYSFPHSGPLIGEGAARLPLPQRFSSFLPPPPKFSVVPFAPSLCQSLSFPPGPSPTTTSSQGFCSIWININPTQPIDQFSSTLTSVELVISPFYRYSHPKLSSRFFHPDRPCGLHSVYPKRLDSPASRADSAFLEHTALNLSPSVNVPAPLWKKAVNKKGS